MCAQRRHRSVCASALTIHRAKTLNNNTHMRSLFCVFSVQLNSWDTIFALHSFYMTDASVNSNTASRIGNLRGMGSIGVRGAVEKYPDFLRFLKNRAILFQNYFSKVSYRHIHTTFAIFVGDSLCKAWSRPTAEVPTYSWNQSHPSLIQSNLVISNYLISNYRLSRRENLVPVLTWNYDNR